MFTYYLQSYLKKLLLSKKIIKSIGNNFSYKANEFLDASSRY